ATPVPSVRTGEAILAGWRMLLDGGRLQDGEPHLAGTARPAVARVSAATAAGIGVADGAGLTVSSGRGSVTLPCEVTEMADGVVWLPLNSPGSAVHRALGVTTGAVVRIEAGGRP
ncbi:MAG: NADH-quinone oxidoreductase subunit G, partial [Mycobacterium sp.]|nr:NADH-quinone oxidoreductase subunit G [Mycobacterium sp.]